MVRIAVVGCVHGELDLMYETLNQQVPKPELILVCGDFQALRDDKDLESISVPKKYLRMGDFQPYHNGTKSAPILTLVIGGNHESSRFFREIPNGGWLAKNIYYLGDCGLVKYNGITIAGLSGIFYAKHYLSPRNEEFPFPGEQKFSVYHQRQTDVKKLWDLGPNKIDIFLSHDWPNTVEHYASEKGQKILFKLKPAFQRDSQLRKLGSPPLFELLTHLQPTRWFSAHMHVKFEVDFVHGSVLGRKTQFMALDKVKAERNWWFHCFDWETESSDGLEILQL